jgi:hypothetical protein
MEGQRILMEITGEQQGKVCDDWWIKS